MGNISRRRSIDIIDRSRSGLREAARETVTHRWHGWNPAGGYDARIRSLPEMAGSSVSHPTPVPQDPIIARESGTEYRIDLW